MPWFDESVSTMAILRYSTEIRFRRRLLAGTKTGQLLIAMFGAEWFRGMWIDVVNPHRGFQLPDHEYMADVVARRHPLVVITFGNIAESGWNWLLTVPGAGRYYRSITHLHCPHPNAMGITQDALDAFAMKLMACRVP